MVDSGKEPSKLKVFKQVLNQITLSLPGSGTEGSGDRRAPPQVQLVLSLEQLYSSVMRALSCRKATGSQHLGLEY